jgi:glycerophosphoryl diester phosphodiesterase family protein
MSMDLRPLSLGELLDRSFSVYRRHFWTFVAIMALPSAFALCLGIVMQLMQRAMAPRGGQEPDFELIAGSMALWGGALFLMFLGYAVAYMVALGATTNAVSEIYLGRPATAAGAYMAVRRRTASLILLLVLIGVRVIGVFFGTMVVAGIGAALLSSALRGAAAMLAGLLVLGLMAAAGLLTIFMMLRYALAVPSLVLEDLRGRQAIRRSIDLSKGNLGRIIVLVVFATIIVYVTALIFQGPFVVGAVVAGPDTSTAFWLNLTGSITGAVAGAISGPLMIIALALLYYDARVRQEGLDLQIMMNALDAPRRPAPPPRPTPSGALPG